MDKTVSKLGVLEAASLENIAKLAPPTGHQRTRTTARSKLKRDFPHPPSPIRKSMRHPTNHGGLIRPRLSMAGVRGKAGRLLYAGWIAVIRCTDYESLASSFVYGVSLTPHCDWRISNRAILRCSRPIKSRGSHACT